jgi:hypothetical protein
MGFLDWLLNPIQDPVAVRPTSQGMSAVRPATPHSSLINLQEIADRGMAAANGFATGQDIGEATRSLIGGKSGGGPNSGGAGLPSFDEWLAQMGLGNVPSGTVSTDVANYSAMAGDQYNPVINYLKKSIKRGKKEGRQGDRDIKQIYSAMARGNEKAADKIGRIGDRGEDRIQALGEQLARRTSDNSERAMNRIIDENDRLDLSHTDDMATQDVRKTLGRNQVYQTDRSNSALQALDRQNSNWENYARAQSNISRMEGASQRADLASELQNLIFGLRGQIATTKSEQAAAILQAQMQEDQMRQAAEQFNAQASQSAYGARAGLLDNYQGDIAQLMEAMSGGGSGEPKEPMDLEGWAALGDEYKGFLKSQGQHSGAPGRNTAQAMDFLRANMGKLEAPAYGANPQADAIRQLTELWNEQGGYEGTQIPPSAIQYLAPLLFKEGLL